MYFLLGMYIGLGVLAVFGMGVLTGLWVSKK